MAPSSSVRSSDWSWLKLPVRDPCCLPKALLLPKVGFAVHRLTPGPAKAGLLLFYTEGQGYLRKQGSLMLPSP